MGVYSDGSYNVPAGLIYSFPVTCRNGEWSIVQGIHIFSLTKVKTKCFKRVGDCWCVLFDVVQRFTDRWSIEEEDGFDSRGVEGREGPCLLLPLLDLFLSVKDDKGALFRIMMLVVKPHEIKRATCFSIVVFRWPYKTAIWIFDLFQSRL